MFMENALENFEISISSATCLKSNNTIFSDINYILKSGELLLVMGPNGCGKTTFIKSICGIQKLEEGAIKLNNVDISHGDSQHLGSFLYIGHKNSLNDNLTVFENLEYLCALDRSIQNNIKSEITRNLSFFGIENYKNYLVSKLSEGNKKKTSLTRLLLTNKKVWLLDEPLNGIDTKAISTLKKVMIQHLKQNGSILFSSHVNLNMQLTRRIILKKIIKKLNIQLLDKWENFK